MNCRDTFSQRKKPNPYAPLLLYGFLALAIFIAFKLIESTMCKMMAVAVKGAPCTVGLPGVVYYVPPFFLLLGAIGTAWNLMRSRTWPHL